MVKTYVTVGYHGGYDAEILYAGISKEQAMKTASYPSCDSFSVFAWEDGVIIAAYFKGENEEKWIPERSKE